uniref:Insulin n=1 Tax=Cyclopterus lumpus TaxID=8103 RepID=A0A8C3GAC4_CYCLU
CALSSVSVIILSKSPSYGPGTMCRVHAPTPLVNTLYFVCGERSFFHRPNRHKQDMEHLWELLTLFFPSTYSIWLVARGGEQCCHKTCSIYYLEGYCG